ncbi:MAG TPA: hypothetical protein VIF09_09185 [Polyangiaceae bacterium]|jgi:hypothetical protein
MRGSLRVHSAFTLALLIGWSLVSGARERIAPTRLPAAAKASARAQTIVPAPPRVVDPRLLN